MKKRIGFGIFCVLIFAALVAGLILFNRLKDDESPSNEPLPKEDDIIYATNVFLNCPREITIQVGTKVELLEGFLTIQPNNITVDLEIEISSKVNNEDGITFENNTIFATDTGFYYIKFTVPKSNTQNIYDTLVVHAIEHTQEITQIKTEVYENDTFNLNEIFNISSSLTIQDLTTSNNMSYEDNKLKFNAIGDGEVNITLSLDYVLYNYSFNITINKLPDPPKYVINIPNYETCEIEFSFISNKIYSIVYEITDGVEKQVNQSVTILISDTSVANFVSADECFIKFRCKREGTFTLTIIYDLDNSITRELTITLK